MKLPSANDIKEKLPTKEQLKNLGTTITNGVKTGAEVVVHGTKEAVKVAKEWVPDVVYDKYDDLKSKLVKPKDIEVKEVDVVQPETKQEVRVEIDDDDDDNLPFQ